MTGATGFIGANLLHELSTSGAYQVFCLQRASSQWDKIESLVPENQRYTYTDDLKSLTENLEAIRPDVVIHLASFFIAEHKSAQVPDLLNSNVVFPAFLLEAMQVSGCRKLINTGTSWQHFQNQEYNPVSLYAATKEAFESLCTYYVEAHGWQVLNLHLSDSYGPGDTRGKIISTLQRLTQSGESIGLSPGEQLIDLVHIKDIVAAYQSAIHFVNEINGQKTYAITSGAPLSLKKLVQLCEQVSGRKLQVRFGERPYRQREMMTTWTTGQWLPEWSPQVRLQDGLKEIFNV